MIRVKMMPRNEVAVIDHGKVYLFDMGGNCVAEDAGFLDKYMSGALDLPVISVLSSNGVCELGVSATGQPFKRYSTSLESTQAVMTLMSQRGYIKILKRSGKTQDARYNQMLYVYPENTDLSRLLALCSAKEMS